MVYRICGVVLMVACSGVVMATEQASYEVERVFDGFELRRYDAQIVVETEVEASFDRAGNMAFRRLFSYISGKNAGANKIAMTAPVSQERTGERIAMTAPVTSERSREGWRVAFLLPSSYGWESAPDPLNPDVVLRQIPERLMVAVRFSGTWGEERFLQHERELREALAKHGFEAIGREVYARYDPPFKPWFLRRNEVLIPVQRSGAPTALEPSSEASSLLP